MFAPLITSRLRVRQVERSDVDALVARRNDPEVAALQSWETPFPLSEAKRIVTTVGDADEPPVDSWWMLTVERLEDGVVVGDLALRLGWDGRAAEIGYTFARESWGQGFATEATGALVDALFARPELTRIHATLHPDNHRSARVLENLGFRFEGRTRLSFWVGGENSDDALYGLVRADHDEWRARPTGPPHAVRLVEITTENAGAVERLVTHKSQERFVAPNLHSFADALFPEEIDGAPVVPWYRAVEADDELVGFVMLAEITEAHPEPYLWRLMVDRRHQRRGIGDRVLDLVVEQCRGWGAETLAVSWEEGAGGPRPFYERRGFVPTGRIIDGETEAQLHLAR